jgi:arylsulfatase A-like enzyme
MQVKKPNIILISIDTLRYDHLSCYGYCRTTTPRIDQFSGKSVLYNNAYSTAAWTPPAHASMLTGLYPSQHGVIDQNHLPPEIPTLAKILRKNGYHTCGFVNNSQVGEMVGFNDGHDDYYEIWQGLQRNQFYKRLKSKYLTLRGYADNGAFYTNQKIKYWINKKWNQQKSFYMFIHYIEAHNPVMIQGKFEKQGL